MNRHTHTHTHTLIVHTSLIFILFYIFCFCFNFLFPCFYRKHFYCKYFHACAHDDDNDGHIRDTPLTCNLSLSQYVIPSCLLLVYAAIILNRVFSSMMLISIKIWMISLKPFEMNVVVIVWVWVWKQLYIIFANYARLTAT